MKNFKNSIRTKLISIFLLVSLFPIALIGYISIDNSYNALEKAEFNQLRSVGELKTNQITNYLNNRFTELSVLSKSGDALSSYYKLIEYHDKGGADPEGEFYTDNDKYRKIYQEINPFFKLFNDSFHFHDLFFICAEHGHIMYTTKAGQDLGANLAMGNLKSSGLAKTWKKVLTNQQPMLIDYSYYEPAGRPVAFIGAPVYDADNNLLAVIALELDTKKINEIMQERSGLGETGETYLVGDDFYMRSNSRFIKESTILNTKVDTKSSHLGLQDKKGVHIIDDYRGVEVLSYYSYIVLDKEFKAEFDWVIISEIDASEAFASANFLTNEILVIALIIAVIIAIIAYIFSKSFTKPIINLTRAAEEGAKGDLKQSFDVKSKDEIGLLAQAFKTMLQNMQNKAEQAMEISKGNLTIEVETLSDKDEMGKAFKQMTVFLKEQINEISKAVATLTSSNSQLMATVAQVSSSSSETVTTVSEVSTTIEEVKQTAEVSTQKAKNVAETANKSVQISEKGIRSTEDAIDGMNLIQDQVKKIADTIIKLSEQSQTIGEITSAVSDLAEQSNLLAVNASIEAVKAGEYGKGFGVVAQEIRALADQSKQATRQIRDILSDVQKAISSAVMATEEGGKAVEKGVNLAEVSGDAISMLADSISEAAQASSQIAASSQQQLTGMEQLAVAMDNIKQATQQNESGNKETEKAVESLKTLVETLKIITAKYKLD